MSKITPAEISKFGPIDAMPTKELFIDMLTRDILLIPSIVDLVDNCTDGAQNLRGDKRFHGLNVRLVVNPDQFTISDNCGGMSIEIAQESAFRFGRPDGTEQVKHSVGKFGVGMKRALFKIGKEIKVESVTKVSRFTVEIDVEKWAKEPEWEFKFKELERFTDLRKIAEHGTTITVKKLRSSVASEFALSSFVTDLKNELEKRIVHPLSRGLSISVNGIPLNVDPLKLLDAKGLTPAVWEHIYKTSGEKPVTAKIYCGLGDSSNTDMAGWHVFCNGRLVLQGDKSRDTGWGDKVGEVWIPGFHGQYNLFRGYVFLDSDDAGRLPWNTTKTGINGDSDIWRAVRIEMKKLMLPVKNFLDALKNEKESREREMSDDPGALEKLVSSAKELEMVRVSTRPLFEMPRITSVGKSAKQQVGNILYSRPIKQINSVKKKIGALTYKEVGEMTFDYYFQAEVEDE